MSHGRGRSHSRRPQGVKGWMGAPDEGQGGRTTYDPDVLGFRVRAAARSVSAVVRETGLGLAG
ncbi:MAG: hypothetical protein KGO50_10325 [Myxococcales bacterium]|nr:hypothetical protein [Myxococcales bacterium]